MPATGAPVIVSEYVRDLVEEKQISGTLEEIAAIKKASSGQIWGFVKHTLGKGRLGPVGTP